MMDFHWTAKHALKFLDILPIYPDIYILPIFLNDSYCENWYLLY